MTRTSPRLSPNQSRLLYDGLAALLSSLVALAFGQWATGEFALPLLAALPLLLGANFALGIYTHQKTASGQKKALRLSLAIAAASAAMLALPGSAQARMPVLLWATLVWSPLCLPRLFLNLNKRVSTDFFGSTIRGRGPVLVVGGAGYIGTHVIEQLLLADYSVRVLDRLLYGRGPLQDFLGNPRFEIIDGDATDIVKLVEAMSGASAVIHLAGLVGDPACAVDESFTRHANVITTRMVKEVATSMGVSRFIFASSCSVYGSTDKEVNETSDLNPVSLYARTKIDSETELLLSQSDTFLPTILRFATVFGHSRRPRFDLVANLFTAQAMTDGKITLKGEHQWRPFIHVRDLARAVVAVLRASPEKTAGQIFNVGDERLNMTLGELANTVQATVAPQVDHPVEVLNQPDVSDRRNYAVSFKKIQRVLGYRAATLLREGIDEMAQAFRSGAYGNYRAPAYSNLEVTKQASVDFHDPQQSARLYGPLVEMAPRSPESGVASGATPSTSQPRAASS